MTGRGIVGEYRSIAEDAGADLLAMQVGDFYEFFGEDAKVVARELDLQLTEKRSDGSTHPMAGVPVAELEPHLQRLVERGYRVAVADQHETDDGHHRDLARIVTPGSSLAVGDGQARYLAALVAGEDSDLYGLAFADVRTGRFRVTTVADEETVIGECDRHDPVELLPGPGLRETPLLARLADRTGATVSTADADHFAPGRATHVVRNRYGEDALESFGLAPNAPATRAAGAMLGYLNETGTGVTATLTRLGSYRPDAGVTLDATTRFNLELTRSMREGGGIPLIDVIDHTETAAGCRLLSERMTQPICDQEELERRLDALDAFTAAPLARESLRETLANAHDLARLASKTASGTATPHDLAAIRDGLALVPDLEGIIDGAPELADSPVAGIIEDLDRERARTLAAELEEALVSDPPGSVASHGIFRRGYDDEIDAVVERHDSLTSYFETIGEAERDRLGVTHLQVGRNKTDGYYLQLGKSEVSQVPEEYREIKQLKNSHRYTTEELEAKEREMFRVEERRLALERDRFESLRARVAEDTDLLQDVGRAFAALDVAASLAVHAVGNDWHRPRLSEDQGVEIAGGRHPVVEQTVEFVPNDTRLGPLGSLGDRADGPDSEAPPRFVIVTGPNMSGKSTYLRQVALIVLLAQIGSFVPARSAHIGTVDGIFTRVGALDELAAGRSTFMVEMQELSKILHTATENSLVILDEVGRGTATYDGISIAWAATEYLHNEVRALTLFATHYHELTGLAEHLPGVANAHVAAEETDGDVTFLHTVERGPTDRSYGIHVADLAGVPDPVIDRADVVLERLRTDQAVEARGGPTTDESVQAVFDLDAGTVRSGTSADGGRAALDDETAAIVQEITEVPIEELSPIELVRRVDEWQRRLED